VSPETQSARPARASPPARGHRYRSVAETRDGFPETGLGHAPVRAVVEIQHPHVHWDIIHLRLQARARKEFPSGPVSQRPSLVSPVLASESLKPGNPRGQHEARMGSRRSEVFAAPVRVIRGSLRLSDR
jgi:hypothetical protein